LNLGIHDEVTDVSTSFNPLVLNQVHQQFNRCAGMSHLSEITEFKL